MDSHKRRLRLSLLAIVITLIIGLCEAREVMNGRFTQNIDDFEFSVPHKVDQAGGFVSFHLPNFFLPNFAVARQKRDFNHHETIRYRINFDTRDHVVELLPNHGLVSPQFLREFHFNDSGKTLKGRRFKSEPPVMCHYLGKIQNDDKSRAAISTCDGLAGYIETKSGRYLIEPVAGHGANDDGHLLHVIHKIDSRSVKSQSCGTMEWKKGWQRALNRSVRSKLTETNKHRFMEVMVVADKKFLDYNRNNDPERYILTIMNMVSGFYHDASLGYSMDIVVLRIVQLDDDKPKDLDISEDALKTIHSFCKWQHHLVRTASFPPHDTAVLLTRHDICMDGSCGLLGLANVAGICDPHASCSINEDNGLMLGVTVAHEIGHLMGCDHDTGGDCPSLDKNRFNFVMSPEVNMATVQWSNCSRRYMKELFDNKLGECLNNEPKASSYKLDDSLPGTIYDADYQCRMEFGDTAKVCQWKIEMICEKLICQIGEKCRTRNSPAADGSSCGKDKWCIRKQCVPIGKRSDDAIAGGWSEWSEWGKCSRQCGGGIQYSRRDCTNPVPRNGGRYCIGEIKRLRVCNLQPCPPETPSFRQQQCEAFNDGRNKWISHFKSSDSCVLFCKNQKNENLEKPKQVKDGTLCKPGTNNLCIAGECKIFGCDWKLNSRAVDDRCGICDGNAMECKVVNGTLAIDDEASTKSIFLPLDARNVVLKKLAPSKSRIKLTDLKTKTNLLEKDNAGGEVDLGNERALLVYPEVDREEIFIKGPLTKSFQVKIGRKIKVSFEYAELKNQSQMDEEQTRGPFAWDFLQPDEKCDARCNGGVQYISPVCVSRDGELPDKSCKGSKPPTRTRPCNTHHCSYKWQKDDWSVCSRCEQKRNVWCGLESRRWDDKPLVSDDDKCSTADGLMPPIKRFCSSECTRNCGEHRLTRSEQFKNLNVLMFEPEIFFSRDDVRQNHESETESFQSNDMKSSKAKQFQMEQPVMMKVFEDRRSRKVNDGAFVVDKLTKEKIEDIPIVKNKEQNLSDEIFRTLGDKLEETLDVEHATVVRGRKGQKAK